MLAHGDGRPHLPLRRPEIPVLLGDSRSQLVRPGLVDPVKPHRHRLSLGRASAYNARSLVVELTQIRQRLGIARVQSNRPLELHPRPLGQPVSLPERRSIGLLAQRPAQPKAIHGDLRLQAGRLLALDGRVVPLFQREQHPAAQVVRQRRVCLRRRQPAQNRHRRVGSSRLQGRVSFRQPGPLCNGGNPHGEQRKAHKRPQQRPQPRSSLDRHPPLHRTSLMGTPSCSGCPLSVPVATQSPPFNPERIAASFTFLVP